MISFGVIGASIKTGNVDLLSTLTVPEADRPAVLANLKEACGFAELVAVFTCNRVEFYFETEGDRPSVSNRNRLLDFFLRGKNKVTIEPSDVYFHSTFRALQHLFRVAGSLDSMVVGEAQILGQVKQALCDAQNAGLCGQRLTGTFTEAFRVAKKIRRETTLGQKSVSMVSLVLDAVNEYVEKHGKSTVAIVGVGPMSVKLAGHLKDNPGIEFFFVNRTVSKAAAVAAEFNCRALSLDDFTVSPVAADIIFTSTGAPHPIFNRAAIERLQSARGSDVPLLVIDLAIPRDVDAKASEVANVRCLDIPYFQATADRNRRARFVAVDQAERIVDTEVGRAHRANAERQFRPVFSAALNEGLAYAHAGLERLFSAKLGHLSDSDRSAISHFTDKLVRYANHLPVSALAEQADTYHGNCSMIAGFGCMQTRAVDAVESDHPSANRCARTEGKACILEGKPSFNCE